MGCKHPLAKKSKINHPYEQLRDTKEQKLIFHRKNSLPISSQTPRASTSNSIQKTQPNYDFFDEKTQENLDFTFSTPVLKTSTHQSKIKPMSSYPPKPKTSCSPQQLSALLQLYHVSLDQLFYDFQQYLNREKFSIHRIAPTIYREPKKYFIWSLFHIVEFNNIVEDQLIFATIARSVEEQIESSLSHISRKLWVKQADIEYEEEDMLTVLIDWTRCYKKNTGNIEEYLIRRFSH